MAFPKCYKHPYSQQLDTSEWKLKRLEILERDNFTCQVCMSNEDLQVHHKKYLWDKKAWDYPNEYLITLCMHHHILFEYDKNPDTFTLKFIGTYEKLEKMTIIRDKTHNQDQWIDNCQNIDSKKQRQKVENINKI